MSALDPSPEQLRSPPRPGTGGLICHTPQPTPPVDDDDDDEDEDNDRKPGGGNIDPDDDEGGFDDDEDDDDDTLWTRRRSRLHGVALPRRLTPHGHR
jgi:hypothetical protein